MQRLDFSGIAIAVVLVWVIAKHFVQAARQWRRLITAFGRARPSSASGRYAGGGSLAIDDVVLGPWLLFLITPRGLRMQGRGPLHWLFGPVLVPWSSLEVRRYIRLPLGRGYEVVAVPQRDDSKPLRLFLPDRIVRAARVFIDIPESERPDR